MEADTHVNLLGLLFLGIVGTKLCLNTLRALGGVDDGGKLDQEAVSGSLNDVVLMRSYSLLDDLVMNGQYPQRAGFVGTHLATKTHHICEHDGGQSAGLDWLLLWRFPPHGSDYPPGVSRLSTGTGTLAVVPC